MIKNQLKYLFVIVFIALGCGKDSRIETQERSVGVKEISEKVFWGSCDTNNLIVVSERYCREYYGEYFQKFNIEHSCAGQFFQEFCPVNSLIGICRVSEAESSDSLYYYYEVNWTVLEAKIHCQSTSDDATWLEQ